MSHAQDTLPTMPAIAVDALTQWLARNVPDFAGPLQVQAFEGGQSNPTYALITPKTQYVMRCKPAPAAQLLPSAHAIEREFRVMSALHNSAVPVPRMLCLCEDEAVIGRAFYIMERVEGRIWWDQSLPELAPAERRAVYLEMNRVLSVLHALDPTKLGLADYGRPGNYFERQIKRWSQQYQASVTQPITEMDRLIDWLPAHIPALAQDPTLVGIVHGDYRLDNLIFHPTEPRVVAVLDWELSTLGHPLADFSYHCMTWHIAPGTFRGIAGLDLAALGIPSESQYIQHYCRGSGRFTAEQLAPDWPFLMAYNLFRMAAILQGIAKRIELGTAASAQARQAAAGARPLAELAWRFAQRAS
ncbi:MAG: phosphotransferase [Rhodoferax sp.]